MKRLMLSLLLGFVTICSNAQDANAPVKMRQSADFDTPNRYPLLSLLPYNDVGIFNICNKGVGDYNIQLFGNDLKFKKEKDFDVSSRLSDKANSPEIIRMGNKVYLLVRDVYKDTKTEGLSALEFFPDKMTFDLKDKKLIESDGKVAYWFALVSGIGWATSISNYSIKMSENEQKLLITYRRTPEKRSDKLNNDIIGMFVFDQSLNKIWGNEIKMPYTEAKMDNLDYLISNDGKVYMIAQVYEGETPKEGRSKKLPNYHLELLVYDGAETESKKIKIELDKLFPVSSSLYESNKGEILLTGFYAKELRKPIDGAYVLSLNESTNSFKLKNGGIFEIPTEIIKSYASTKEVRRLERKQNKDDENDIGVENLIPREIYLDKDGSLKLIAEQYKVVTSTSTTSTGNGGTTTRTTYDTYSDDLFVISASPDGKYWVKKIPKTQHSNDATGAELSYNSIMKDGNLYLFYVDNKKNKELQPNEAPKTHQQGRGGYLACMKLDKEGNESKSYLGEIDEFETNFYIRYFKLGDGNNLIYSARKRKKNSLISLDVL